MAEKKKGGLGRGLAALIPTSPESGPQLGNSAADILMGASSSPTQSRISADSVSRETSELASEVGAVYREIPITQIAPNPRQPRSVFDEEALNELVHSIREFGLMQPIVVRQSGNNEYQIIMGERRWRASTLAGLEAIPAIVRETEDGDLLRDALLENIHRVQLNPLEEAAAYQQLLEDFKVTHEELAERLGRSRPVITNMIRLLRLPVPVQRRVAAGVLSAGHARAILGIEQGTETKEFMAARVVAEGLSVRATEEAVLLLNRGDGSSAPKQTATPAPDRVPALDSAASRWSSLFDTKVTVSMGKKKGKVVVEFGSLEDLERITSLLGKKK